MKSCLAFAFFATILLNSPIVYSQVFDRSIGQDHRGKFLYATALCFANDRYYVVERSGLDHVIKVFDSQANFLFEFGSFGSGAGMLDTPMGIAADKDGFLYVAEMGNDRIQKFNKNGIYVAKWGTLGTEANQFTDPTAIAIDKVNGFVYVAEWARISKYKTDGTYLASYRSFQYDNNLVGIQALAVDSDGSIYAAGTPDRSNLTTTNYVMHLRGDGILLRKVNLERKNVFGLAIDGQGNLLGTYSQSVDGGSEGLLKVLAQQTSQTYSIISGLSVPNARGVITLTDGSLLIAMMNQLQRAIIDVGIVATFGTGYTNSAGSEVGKLNYPLGTGADASGNIYIADRNNYRIQKFSPTGTSLLTFGNAASLKGPVDVAIDPATGNILVLDTGPISVKVFNSSGVLQTSWGTVGTGNGQFSASTSTGSIVFDPSGSVWVTDSYRIHKFSSAGVHQLTLGSTQGNTDTQFMGVADVAFDATGNMYVAEQNTTPAVSRVKKFSKELAFIKSWAGGSTTDSNLFFASLNSIAVSSTGTILVGDFRRVMEFTPNGDFIRRFGGYADFGSGYSDRELRVAKAITASSGAFYISDTDNHRIQKYLSVGVTGMSPGTATKGAQISVTGIGLHPELELNDIRFADSLAVEVSMVSANEIKVNVPSGAITGRISISRNGITSYSDREFVVAPLEVTSFAPNAILANAVLTINGRGFSSNIANNSVKIGDKVAPVITAKPNQLTVVVPEGVSKGKITLKVEDVVAVSATEVSVTILNIDAVSYPKTYLVTEPSASAEVGITNPDRIKSLRFFYRGLSSGSTEFKSETVPFTSAFGKMQAIIPKSVFSDPIGVKGYLVITDPNDVESILPEAYIYNKYPSGSTGPRVPGLIFGVDPTSYQLVSFPTVFTNSTSESIFNGLGVYDVKKWRLFQIKNGAIEELTQPSSIIALGKSYWLIAKTATDIFPGEGTSFRVTDGAPYEMILAPGWNMIGSPYNFPISWNDVLAANDNPASIGTLRHFSSGSYITGDLLNPYRGAFVNNSGTSNVVLKIPYINKNLSAGREHKRPPNSIDSQDWFVGLTFTDGIIRNELAGVGMSPDASIELDSFDESPLPAPEGLRTFEFNFRNVGRRTLIRDIVPTANANTRHRPYLRHVYLDSYHLRKQSG